VPFTIHALADFEELGLPEHQRQHQLLRHGRICFNLEETRFVQIIDNSKKNFYNFQSAKIDTYEDYKAEMDKLNEEAKRAYNVRQNLFFIIHEIF
jgi:hypothetical protein